MLQFIIRRAFIAAVTLLGVSIVAFVIIQLPPGDYLTAYIAQLRASGDPADQQTVEQLQEFYGLDQPLHIQYLRWISGILLRGDFGYSLEWRVPVQDLIWNRLALTLLVSISTLLFTWLIALPIGILSAVRQYSWFDYFTTFVGFIGLGIPNFLLALVLMYISFAYFGTNVGGLFSAEYENAAWSIEKILDLLSHLWVPVVVLGTAGTAELIRIMRANLLDELHQPYVTTARAKGLSETELLIKYPVRVALNPFISTIGWTLPNLISGATITAIVLSLPTTGPLLVRSLLSQDMYLAGAFVLTLSALTIIGTLISDILLAWADPRIRIN